MPLPAVLLRSSLSQINLFLPYSLFRLMQVFGVNCEGRINEFNEYMTEITGFSADEVFHAHFCTTFIEESRQSTTEEMVQSAVKGRGTTNVDMEIRTKFGEIRSLLLSASPRRNAQNELVGAIFFAQDTTESAKHDRAVAAMASELRQLIDTANAPVRKHEHRISVKSSFERCFTNIISFFCDAMFALKDFWYVFIIFYDYLT